MNPREKSEIYCHQNSVSRPMSSPLKELIEWDRASWLASPDQSWRNFKTSRRKKLSSRTRNAFKGTNMFVREDFSEKILAKRKELLPKMHEERRKGNIAFLRYDKLVTYPRRDQDFTGSAPPYSSFFPTGRGRGSGRGSPPRPGKDWECPHTVDNS